MLKKYSQIRLVWNEMLIFSSLVSEYIISGGIKSKKKFMRQVGILAIVDVKSSVIIANYLIKEP